MGNASSIDTSKSIYIDVSGKTQKIVFSAHCSSHDICQLLAQAVGAERNTEVLVKDGSSALVAVSPTMPLNSPQEPYKVELKDKRQKRETTKEVKHTNNVDTKILQVVLGEVADQFNKSLNKVFQIDEMKSSIDKRLVAIERKMEVDNLKIVEIEKCKREISDMKGQIHSAQKKMVDYSRMSSLSDDRKISLKRDVPAYPKYTLSKETIDYLKQPTFDIWHWEPNEMLSLLEHMYHELELVKHFNINPITLKRWLLCVQENYRNNPFHNFRHCFCVTQMMYGMINLCKLTDYLSKEELGILLTACVCHDLDHPGYNNTYQINARTELSIRYNDISPLENHHCAVAFQILSNPETNIFNNVDSVTFKRIRSGMITLILATDMARHSEILESFKAKIDNFDFTNEDHLNSMKMVLIKCCDISNEVRPMSVSEPWVDCLLEEYFNQSDREKEEGLPVAPFMDREKVTKPTAQIGFIKFVLIPMFETIAKLFNQLDPIMVEPLRGARDHYEELREKNAQKELTTKTDAEKAKEKETVKEKEKT